MHLLSHKIIALLMAIAITISTLPLYTFADESTPGTRQILTSEDLGDGTFYLYHSMEDGHLLNLYCFNSDMRWPHSSETFNSDYYVPEGMAHLSSEVQDKIYRIYYAGYPHNNLGLYAENETKAEHNIGELDMAVEPPVEIKELMQEINWNNLNFSAESVLSAGQEGQIMLELTERICIYRESAYVDAAMNKPTFYYALMALLYDHDTVDEFLAEYISVYESMAPTVYSPGAAHDATQYAIWRILFENKVPHNSKAYDDILQTNQLVRDLVDFANGEGDHANADIPERGSTLKELEECKASFESGESLERSDGSSVGKSNIVFQEQPNGYYVSEPLKVVDELHTIPYTAKLIDSNGTLISSQTIYGSNWINFTVQEVPDSAKIILESNHTLPSDIFHYEKESETNIPTEELNKNNYQHMGGCYFESMPMVFEVETEFIAIPRTGDLEVKKSVKGNAADNTKAFDFKIVLKDTSINGIYGDIEFENGVATFTLKDGDNITATGLPAGTEYTVTEADYTAAGYTTTKKNDTGTIVDGQKTLSSFTNTRNSTAPETSDSTHLLLWVILQVLCGVALILVIMHRRIVSHKTKGVNKLF